MGWLIVGFALVIGGTIGLIISAMMFAGKAEDRQMKKASLPEYRLLLTDTMQLEQMQKIAEQFEDAGYGRITIVTPK